MRVIIRNILLLSLPYPTPVFQFWLKKKKQFFCCFLWLFFFVEGFPEVFGKPWLNGGAHGALSDWHGGRGGLGWKLCPEEAWGRLSAWAGFSPGSLWTVYSMSSVANSQCFGEFEFAEQCRDELVHTVASVELNFHTYCVFPWWYTLTLPHLTGVSKIIVMYFAQILKCYKNNSIGKSLTYNWVL